MLEQNERHVIAAEDGKLLVDTMLRTGTIIEEQITAGKSNAEIEAIVSDEVRILLNSINPRGR
ncbi:MAG: hypothetical protein AAB869_02395 [Patescibacteria group bacterium]